MSKKQLKPPTYCLHRASGQAVVRIHGRDRYLGPHGSVESHERYERALAEWRAGQLSDPPFNRHLPGSSSFTLSINELLLRYLEFAASYCVDGSGQPTSELKDLKYALRPVRMLFGRTQAIDFGPRALKTVREHMVEVENLSRKVVNHRINRIRRCFKWAVSEELLPPAVLEGLRSVSGLQLGRTTAREASPIKPVPQPYGWRRRCRAYSAASVDVRLVLPFSVLFTELP